MMDRQAHAGGQNPCPESRIKNKNKQLLTALEEAGAKGLQGAGGWGGGGKSRGGLARALQVSRKHEGWSGATLTC